MSLIEDAKRLAAAEVRSNGTTWCHFCDALIEDPESYTPPMPLDEQHTDGCPWLALPRIVAALEAAQQMLDYIDVPASGYNAKYGLLPGTWWYDWPDQPFVQKIREAMRDG